MYAEAEWLEFWRAKLKFDRYGFVRLREEASLRKKNNASN